MKTKKINEEELRDIINKKVNESIATPIFYVRDEASDGVFTALQLGVNRQRGVLVFFLAHG